MSPSEHRPQDDLRGAIEPDTKDWTWVLRRPCPECRFEAGAVSVSELGAGIRENARRWAPVLSARGVAERPDPRVWSPLEYACHVRDVHRIFDHRIAQMLTEDTPRFAGWDQDRAAVEERYAEQDPVRVAADLAAAAEAVAATYDAVPDDAWPRRGLRGDGAAFTVESLGRYHLHDVVHHAHDVAAAG